MTAQVLSDKLTNRLNTFFENNKDAVVVHKEEDDKKAPQDPGSSSSSIRNAEQEHDLKPTKRKDDEEDEEDDDEELKSLNASSKDLSYRLCGNRLRRNFLRYYLMTVKGKKERVYLNDDGLMVSSFPYMKGTIDIVLTLKGYFETYLVGRGAVTMMIPFSFTLNDIGGRDWADANLHNGRINGFSNEKKAGFDMPIAAKHAVYWFAQGNKHRRIANIPLFQEKMLLWREGLVQQRKAAEQQRIERKRHIDEMVQEAHRQGYVWKDE